jgi:branched-chain amino acid transport system substrate-binding protein
MKKIKILFTCVAVIAGCCTLLYGADEKIFNIGALFPMTGPQAYYGRVMSRGAQLGCDHINADGGVEGYKLKLSITDFQNVDAGLAIIGLQKTIMTKKISVLLTSFSAVTLAVQPLCEAAHVLMLNGGAYSPKIANKAYLHTVRLSQDQMIPPMLRFFWDMNIRRLAVIYADVVAEVSVNEYLKPIWTDMGGSITAVEAHPPGLTDYSPYLARIRESKPDAVYNISTGQDQAFIVKGIRETGLNIPVSVNDWNDDFQSIAGKSSENVYFPCEFFDSNNSAPSVQRFVKDYEAKWKEPPDFYAANYYDTVYNILAELIRRVVKSGGKPEDGAELEKAIWTNPLFDTVYGGKLQFNRDGSSKKQMVIFKIVEGKKLVEKSVTLE